MQTGGWGNTTITDPLVADLMRNMEEEASQNLAQLSRQEAAAEARCRLVRQAVDSDPAALLLYTKRSRRFSVLGYALVAAVTAVVVAALQCMFPQCWQAVRAALAGLAKK